MDTIDINGKPYQVGVDIGEGKDHTRVVVIGDSGCKEALDEMARLKGIGIDVVCVDMDTENMEVLRGFTGITIATSPEMILAFQKASLDYPEVVGHVDESTPKRIDEMELIGPYCPRKNDNKPWYSRFDKRKRR